MRSVLRKQPDLDVLDAANDRSERSASSRATPPPSHAAFRPDSGLVIRAIMQGFGDSERLRTCHDLPRIPPDSPAPRSSSSVKAALFDPTATPPSMRVVDVPSRAVSQGEVRLEVRAVPVSDYWLSLGEEPFVPCWVVAGEIAEVGPGVSHFDVGQRVAAMHRTGGLAEQVVVPVSALRRIPDDLRFEHAVCLTAGMKVSLVVDELLGHLEVSGDRPTVAVVHDGTHFGSIVAGLLNLAGAVVIGVAGPPNSIEDQLSVGFQRAMNPDLEPIDAGLLRLTDGAGVDGFVDHLGETPLGTVTRVLRPGGCFVRCDRTRTPMSDASEADLARFADLDASMVDFAGLEAAARRVGEIGTRVTALVDAITSGSIVLPTTTVPFSDVERVPEMLRSQPLVGSLVVVR